MGPPHLQTSVVVTITSIKRGTKRSNDWGGKGEIASGLERGYLLHLWKGRCPFFLGSVKDCPQLRRGRARCFCCEGMTAFTIYVNGTGNRVAAASKRRSA